MAITASRNAGRRRPRADRLDLPGTGRATLLPRVDREDASRVAETVARFLGTGRYLAIQTGIVIVWIALNVAVPLMRWDPYPFILLNLAFSTQAAYAAPLILLAQNRQDDRDRAALTEDRAVAGRMRDDTEFLTREVAALRLAQSEAATRQYVRGELAGQFEAFRSDLERLLAAHLPAAPALATGPLPGAVTGPLGPRAAAVAGASPAAPSVVAPSVVAPSVTGGCATEAAQPRVAPGSQPAGGAAVPPARGTRTDDEATDDPPPVDPRPAPGTPPGTATRPGHSNAVPAARVASRANTRASAGRAHHRSAVYAGATRRGAEHPKKGD
ncbi:DUF1003 domain-containing protein [Frankia sp. R82]|uniref:DUF1003 domain-containing protein n=1 Tax=Frankia sp. R82 TaxID=2950553 RepID=UPI0020444C3D|nr:DUF1003 domain-containing protein [Frankia sp. R82]MCM3882939.1 DUF1003 domain-containing protein [Frankia sp. R82]